MESIFRLIMFIITTGTALTIPVAHSDDSRSISYDSSNTTELNKEIPKWLLSLRNNPILSGKGIAGLHIGEHENTIQKLLGSATKDTYPIVGDGKEIFLDGQKGRIQYYATLYEHDDILLGIYTGRDDRLIKRIRVFDDSFNATQNIPSYKGITIGSNKKLLKRQLGEPISIDKHGGCTSALKKNENGDSYNAVTYGYKGISLTFCVDNNLIRMIDIKRQ